MNVHIIRTDGREEHAQAASMRDVARLIGAETLDFVNLRDGRVMCVNDNGYETIAVEDASEIHGMPCARTTLVPIAARKPYNAKATALYWSICVPGTTHRVVGDVAIIVDAEVA